jgi:hypothetical protein
LVGKWIYMWIDNWSVSVHDSKNSPTLEQTPDNYQAGSLASIMLYSKTQFSISHIGSQNFENQITGYKFVASFIKTSWVFQGFQNNQNLWFFKNSTNRRTLVFSIKHPHQKNTLAIV